MLTHRLIRLIEEHWEPITERALRRIRHDRELATIRVLPESELREWGRNLLRNLGRWLSRTWDQELADRYELVGRLRFEENVPLFELVHGIHVMKRETLDYIRSEGFGQSSVELYAEEELEHCIGNFFDHLVEHLVHGYEEALRTAAHLKV